MIAKLKNHINNMNKFTIASIVSGVILVIMFGGYFYYYKYSQGNFKITSEKLSKNMTSEKHYAGMKIIGVVANRINTSTVNFRFTIENTSGGVYQKNKSRIAFFDDKGKTTYYTEIGIPELAIGQKWDFEISLSGKNLNAVMKSDTFKISD